MLRAVALIVCSIATTAATADEPLPPPEKQTTCSASGAVCVESDPRTNRTRLISKSSGRAPWVMDGWYRWVFVSEDGESVVVGYAGMNLVPQTSKMDFEVLRFYRRGRLLRTVRLADLYTAQSELHRSISHLVWVQTVRVNAANQLVLDLVNGKTAAFLMSTGQTVALQ